MYLWQFALLRCFVYILKGYLSLVEGNKQKYIRPKRVKYTEQIRRYSSITNQYELVEAHMIGRPLLYGLLHEIRLRV